MKSTIIRSVLLMCLTPVIFAQKSDEEHFSERFSFSLFTAYNPLSFTSYNNAVLKITNDVRTDPYYIEPQGTVETIRGIPEYSGSISYRIYGPWSAEACFSYSEVSAFWEFYPRSGFQPPNHVTTAHYQQLDFSMRSYGILGRYEFDLFDNVVLTGSFGMEYYIPSIVISWQNSINARGPVREIGNNLKDRMTFHVSDQTIGGIVKCGVQWKALDHFRMNLGVRYRLASAKDMTGHGTFYSGSTRVYRFSGQLVESENYFGIDGKEISNPGFSFPPHYSFMYTEPQKTKPVDFSLSSFGFLLGVDIFL